MFNEFAVGIRDLLFYLFGSIWGPLEPPRGSQQMIQLL